MGNVRIVLTPGAIPALEKSPEMLADLEARARRIADAAGAEAAGGLFEVDARVGATRARASVQTGDFAARHAEATGRALTRAIDAGR